MKFHDVWLCSSFYSLQLQQNSFQLNADPPNFLILLQLNNSPQVWKSTRKATNCVSTSNDVLLPIPVFSCGDTHMPAHLPLFSCHAEPFTARGLPVVNWKDAQRRNFENFLVATRSHRKFQNILLVTHIRQRHSVGDSSFRQNWGREGVALSLPFTCQFWGKRVYNTDHLVYKQITTRVQ